MKNNNKKTLSKALKIGSLGLLGISAPIGLIQSLSMSNTIEGSELSNKEIKLNNNNQRSHTDGNFLLNSNNTIQVTKDGQSYNFNPIFARQDSLSAGPRGTLIPNLSGREIGTLSYISNEGEVLWEYKRDGSVVSDFYDYSKQMLGSLYYAPAHCFVIAKMKNVSWSPRSWTFSFITINEENGEFIFESNDYTFNQNGSPDGARTFEWYKNCFMNSVFGSDDCIVMWNQSLNAYDGNKSFAMIWINNDGTIRSGNSVALTRDIDDTGYYIVAARTAWVNNTNWTLAVKYYPDNKEIWLSIYKGFNFLKDIARLATNAQWNDMTNSRLQTAISNIHIGTWGVDQRYIEWCYISNNHGSNNNSYIRAGYIDTSNNSVITKDLSLQESNGVDIDVYSGNIYGDYAYLYVLDYSHFGFSNRKNRIMRLKLNDKKENIWNQNSLRWKGDYSSDSLVKMWDIDDISNKVNETYRVPIIPQGVSQNSQNNPNINIIPQKSKSDPDQIATGFGIQTLNGNSAGYAYKTIALSNNIINLTGLESIYAANATAEQIKNKLTVDLVKTVATQFKTNSTFNVTLSTPTEEQNAQGILPISIIIDGGYSGNSISSSNETRNDIEIHGFKKAYTYVKNPNIQVSHELMLKTTSSVTQEELLNFVRANKNNIFEGLPIGFTDSNIINLTIDNKKSNEGIVNVTITLNSSYTSDNQYTTNRVNFNLSLYGFSPENTGTKINTSDQTLPSSLSSQLPSQIQTSNIDLKKYIKDNMLSNLPSNFSYSNIVDIEFTPDNLTGEIRISSITLNLYLDDNGSVISNQNNVFNGSWIISGFQTSKPTTVKSVVNVDSSMANDDIRNWDDIKIKQYIYDNRENIIQNIPDGFTLSNIIISNVTKLSSLGQITLQVKLNKYYDNNGLIINGTESQPYNLTLTGFTPTSLETLLSQPSNGVSTSTLTSKIPQNIDKNNTDLKEYLINNAITNIPENFNTSNIVNINISGFNNIQGTLTISSITVDKWSDSNGNVFNTEKELENPITINGFHSILPTTIQQSVLVNGTLAGMDISSVTSENLVDWIVQNPNTFINNFPSDFGIIQNSDIEISSFNAIPSEGKINAVINLKKYYDKDGVYVDTTSQTGSSPLTSNVSFLGFQSIDQSTSLIPTGNNVSGSLAQTIPQNVTSNDQDLKNFIVENNIIKNAPENFNISNITNISIGSYDNLQGTLTINDISVNLWNDQYGNSQNSPKTLQGPITIYGFKKTSQTSIVSKATISQSYQQYSANEITDSQMQSYLFENKDTLFNSLPDNFNLNNINITNLNPSSINGTLEVSFNLTNYYNSEGILVSNSNSDTMTITFIGFKKANYSTALKNPTTNITDPTLTSTLPQDITGNEQQLKEFILNNALENTQGLVLNVSNITNINISSINNLEGSITISSIELNKWLDENGNVQNSLKTINGPITISGFKTSNPTTINENVQVTTPLLGSNVSNITDDMLKSWIYSNKSTIFSNLPNNVTNSDITISNVVKKSSTGQITADVTLSKYYDANGNVSTSSPLTKNVTFNGFQQKDLSTSLNISNTVVTGSLKNTIAQNATINNNEFKEFILNNIIINKPSNLTVDKITNINISSFDNVTGQVVIESITIENYNDANGETILGGKTLNGPITISGFKNVSPTSINSTAVASGSLLSKNMKDLTNDDIKSWTYENLNSIVTNLPNNIEGNNDSITINDIDVSEIVKLSSEGKLKFKLSLSKYISNSGEFVTSGTKLEKTIEIVGFNIVNYKTTLNTTYIRSTNETFQSMTAKEAYEDPNIKETLKNIIVQQNILYNTPPGFSASNIVDITLSKYDNVSGSITISNIVLNKWQDANGNIISSSTSRNDNLTINEPLIISGFQQVIPTSAIENVFNLNSGSWEDLELYNKNVNDVKVYEIENWITDNENNLFVGLVENNESNKNSIIENVEIESKNEKDGTIVVKVLIKNYNDYLGEFNDGNREIFIKLQLKKPILTDDNFSEGSNSDNMLWVWVGVGAGGGLLLILLIVLLIVLLKKKNNKNKKKTLQVTRRPSTPPPYQLTNKTVPSQPQQIPQQVNKVGPNVGPVNNNNTINKTPINNVVNNASNSAPPKPQPPKPQIPTPRAGTGAAVKPGLVKNGTVPPRPTGPNTPPKPPQLKK